MNGKILCQMGGTNEIWRDADGDYHQYRESFEYFVDGRVEVTTSGKPSPSRINWWLRQMAPVGTSLDALQILVDRNVK